MGNNTIKNHLVLHLTEDILDHSVPDNVNSTYAESAHIPLSKLTARGVAAVGTFDRSHHVLSLSLPDFSASLMRRSVWLNSGIVIVLAPTWAIEHPPCLHRPVIWNRTQSGAVQGCLFFFRSLVSVNLGQRLAPGAPFGNSPRKSTPLATIQSE